MRLETYLRDPPYFEIEFIEGSWVAVNPSTDYGVVRDTLEEAIGALILESGLVFEFLESMTKRLGLDR